MIIEDHTPQNLGDYHNPVIQERGIPKQTHQCEEMIFRDFEDCFKKYYHLNISNRICTLHIHQ